MATGDVVFESDPFDLTEYYKRDGAGPWEWTAKLKNFTSDSSSAPGEVDMRGDTLAGVFPSFDRFKHYKITITEV